MEQNDRPPRWNKMFICGVGADDGHPLPTTISICPAYGADWSQLYQRVDEKAKLEPATRAEQLEARVRELEEEKKELLRMHSDECNRYVFAQKENAKLCAKLEAAGNLLAVMHRDGGHYIDEHGFEKACKDAENVRHTLINELDSAKGLKEEILELCDSENMGALDILDCIRETIAAYDSVEG